MSIKPQLPPKSVKPRKPRELHLYVIAVSSDSVFVERTGELLPRSELPAVIVREPHSIIACDSAASILFECDVAHRTNKRWQAIVSRGEKLPLAWKKVKDAPTIGTTRVQRFGFKSDTKTKGQRHSNAQWFYPIDSATFIDQPLHKWCKWQGNTLNKLLLWGQDIRDWLAKENLNPVTGMAGIGAQLLRDQRFYPEARRKVPRATNDKARDSLPGNHYELKISKDWPVEFATYYDQKAAHHFAAANMQFPHSDSLYACGYFRDGTTDKKWCDLGDIEGHGLLRVKLARPGLGVFAPACWKPPHRTAWLYTNELELLHSLGGEVEYVIAGWLSKKVDDGLTRYAEWSMQELAQAPEERAAWLKPALLATYGVLAARPRKLQMAYAKATKGKPRRIPVGRHSLTYYHTTSRATQDMPIANVIQRGMIEAHVRQSTIMAANQLAADGWQPIDIYGDAIIVRRWDHSRATIELPEPFRLKHTLSNLVFEHEHAFRSDQLRRMPGMPALARPHRAAIS